VTARRGVTAPAFAFVAGIFYVALGILAMLSSLVLPAAGTVQYGYFLGLFAVNTPLNAVHAFLGMWGLVAWSGALSAVTYGRALAIVLGLMALAGLIPGLRLLFDVLPLHGHNVWLHAVTAALGAWIGWRSLARYELEHIGSQSKAAGEAHASSERRLSAGDRRRTFRPVAMERRRGAPDRRQAEFGGSSIPAG
jgi:hypothetical protein